MIVTQWELREKSGALHSVHWSKLVAECVAIEEPKNFGPACEIVQVRTDVDLHRYTVNLFRRDDSLCLYAIPYDMRPRQQPGDIWRAARDAKDRCYEDSRRAYRGGYGYQFPAFPPEGWIWLCSPGWYGSNSPSEINEIKTFLADLERMSPGIVPGGLYEWAKLKGHPDLRAFHLEHGHSLQGPYHSLTSADVGQ